MNIRAIGIDAGSSTIKGVGVDAGGVITWQAVEPAGPQVEDQAARLLAQAGVLDLGAADRGETPQVLATGYGRRLVKNAAQTITEITCHARGIYQVFARGGTLIDIGGQDSKVIRISPTGKVIDFAMNDKCAAGTGRFLENTASRLFIPVERMGEEAMTTAVEVAISSTCTVFAESEIVSLIAHGTPVPEILRGLHRSLVKRLAAMVHTMGFDPPLMLSGGVVQNRLIVQMIAEELDQEALLPEYPQLIGAYGAALIALDG